MKQQLQTKLLRLPLFIVLAGLTSIAINARDTFDYNDFKCAMNADGTVTIIKGYSAIIPETVYDIWDEYVRDYSGRVIQTIHHNDGPFTVTAIGDGAFYYPYPSTYSLSGQLSIPNTVKRIGNHAFEANNKLTGSLVIPNSVSSIGNHAFYYCSGFKGTLKLGTGVTTIGGGAFAGCGFTGPLVIPNSVKRIEDSSGSDEVYYGYYEPDGAFSNCSGFTSLDLGHSVNYIGSFAFYGCTGLTGSLNIPYTVTYIGEEAFGYCHGFTGRLSIPDSVKTIGARAFQFCTGFSGSPYLGNSLTYIGGGAFAGCRRLSGTLNIPNSVKEIGSERYFHDPSKNLGAGAFEYCTGLDSLNLGTGISKIGYAAFAGCSGFKGKLFLPSTITEISDYAFYKCSGLNGSLITPNSLKTIGNYAFYQCSEIGDSLVIGNSVTLIDFYAFDGCSKVSSIFLPNSLQALNEYAFWGCCLSGNIYSQITDPNSVEYRVTSKYNVYAPDYDAFHKDTKQSSTLHVPVGTKNVYQQHQVWGGFRTIIEDSDITHRLGDVDGNGVVDVDDMNVVINIMLHKAEATAAADVNGDGNVDIDDMNAIINVMLRKE